MQNIRSGVWPTMITPFTESDKIDYSAVENLLAFYDRSGVAGVFAVCQSSEMFHLDLEEKKRLIRFIVQYAPNGMQVVVSGHTADQLDRQVWEAEQMMCAGAAAYVILPNRFAGAEQSDDTVIENMEAFLSKFPSVPLGIYECPFPYKRVLSPEVLRSCVASNRFLFIKDTCCDLQLIAEKLAILDGSGIKLFNANSATLLESLRLGAAGYSGIMANFHPELYAWLCRSFREEPEKAEKLQLFLGVSSLAEHQYYPVNAKYSLALQDVQMGIGSRVLDAGRFAESNRMVIRQLNELASQTRESLTFRDNEI